MAKPPARPADAPERRAKPRPPARGAAAAAARAAAAPPPRPVITPGQRLGATLALAAAIHGIVILGVGFTVDDPAPVVPTLEVILTQTRTETPPERADFLAQASQQGGGEHDEARRPREPQPATVPKEEPGLAPVPLEAQAPPPEPQPVQRVLASAGGSEVVAQPEDAPDRPAERLPTGRELIEQSVEMARLAASVERQQELYARRPSRKFITAATREFEYAAYMRTWVQRVERVGNLNFPEEARRRRLSGVLVMTVEVNRDGTVADIVITTPSGQPLLDQAAMRIVRLAEPFPPLPRTEEDPDILHITRSWRFFPDGTVRED